MSRYAMFALVAALCLWAGPVSPACAQWDECPECRAWCGRGLQGDACMTTCQCDLDVPDAAPNRPLTPEEQRARDAARAAVAAMLQRTLCWRFPSLPGCVASAPPSPASRQLVRICTPQVVDHRGSFLPAARAAIDSGAMAAHFSQINVIVNGMKRDARSELQGALADGKSHALLVVSRFDDPTKTVSVTRATSPASLQCRPGYRTATYPAQAWMKLENLSPRGLRAH